MSKGLKVFLGVFLILVIYSGIVRYNQHQPNVLPSTILSLEEAKELNFKNNSLIDGWYVQNEESNSIRRKTSDGIWHAIHQKPLAIQKDYKRVEYYFIDRNPDSVRRRCLKFELKEKEKKRWDEKLQRNIGSSIYYIYENEIMYSARIGGTTNGTAYIFSQNDNEERVVKKIKKRLTGEY